MCCDKYFSNITGPETDLIVSHGGLSNQKVCGIGTAMISLIDKKGQLFNLSLEKAVYVPTFHFNLLSVDNLVSAGNKVTFEPSKSQTFRKNNILELFREEKNYFTYKKVSLRVPILLFISLGQWHCRLGHLNTTTIEKMENIGIVKGLKIGSKSKEFCGTYASTKAQMRLPTKNRVKSPRL